MPMHDWTRVEHGIYHAFHHGWIGAISSALNSGVLPEDYYALPEQVAAGFGPDGLTEAEYYRRKKSSIAIRHASGDRLVAIVEIVSAGDKSSKNAIRAFVKKSCELLGHRIHLLTVDPFRPGPYDPVGLHGLIWSELEHKASQLHTEKPLTLASYECDSTISAYLEPLAVGDAIPEMPLFLVPKYYIGMPLEQTYRSAFESLPRRWRSVLQAK